MPGDASFKERLEAKLRASPDICYETERCVALAGARAALLLVAEECGSSATYHELKSPGCAMARALRAEYEALTERAATLSR